MRVAQPAADRATDAADERTDQKVSKTSPALG
jgi:hypothetical protein